VIFATCGSSHLGFDRMMEALAAFDSDLLHVQHGPAKPPPAARADAYLSFAEVVEQIDKASVVVSHAGVGSILCALRAGHTPIVFPRLKRYAETVDDHQAELARALADRGSVLVAWNGEDLAAALASVPPRGLVTSVGSETLHAAVRAAIIADSPPRRRHRRQAGAAAWAEQ
jgi:UDP-N-acetylglucosamine transferase subunit ALG13